MYSNSALANLPQHLKELVVDQHYENYTPQDHALWRYVMRQNVNFLSKVAHDSYVNGLKSTGISIDTIPNVDEMNRIMEKIGWGVVAVDGFIPPSAFMEFQAYHVLVIAADIRPIDQIGYTPAPDIIHEAAGHAPIIADPEYAEYLRRFGEIGSKAFQTRKDYELYEAIRHLSILKADPYTPEENIREANRKLQAIEQNMGEPSEMAKIRNLHWWTVEYGLVGEIENPQIYGAGLLSSIAESYNCLQPAVKKLPYNLETANVGFDITEEQPQLFVTSSFKHLTEVLEAFTCLMGIKQGGILAAQKAKNSGAIATLEYSGGLQVAGVLENFIENSNELVFLKFSGPCQLASKNKQLAGHGKEFHQHGFSSPVGKFKGINKPPEDLNDNDLIELGLIIGKESRVEFDSGLYLHGKLSSVYREDDKLLLLSFENCTVKYKNEILFEPAWGSYDMAVGATIKSGYAGCADPVGFNLTYPIPEEKTHKIQYSEKDKSLHKIYQTVRDIRNQKIDKLELIEIFEQLKNQFPNDWLCAVEIAEIAREQNELNNLYHSVYHYLQNLMIIKPNWKKLINDGLHLLED